MSEYNIKIVTALNGYVVINNQNTDEIFLVNEDQSLGDAIMGVLVAQKLAGIPSKKSAEMTTSEIDDLLYEKSKWEQERKKLRDEREHYMREKGKYRYNSSLGAGSQLWGTGTTLASSAIAQDAAYDAQRYAMMAQNIGLTQSDQGALSTSILDALRQEVKPPPGVSKKKGWL